jgi:hypothetical protein
MLVFLETGVFPRFHNEEWMTSVDVLSVMARADVEKRENDLSVLLPTGPEHTHSHHSITSGKLSWVAKKAVISPFAARSS